MVNMKTLGKMLLAGCFFVALIGRASTPHDLGAVVPMGNDTYSITREAKSAFTRDADKLRADASDAAAKFCAAQGKQLKVISLTSKVPMFSTGYAKATIIFQALNAGDPALAAEPAAGQPTIAVAVRPPSTDELYNDLLKLDDLRKKGILTDDEFQAEKKKLLAKTK